MKKRLKKMNIREFRMFVSAAQLLSTASENIREDGSVNWDFVSADLYMTNDAGEFRDEDVEAVLCAADLGIDPEMIVETRRGNRNPLWYCDPS